MKYIRTKDGKIYEVVDNNGTWTTNQISKDIVEKALNGNKYFKDDIQIIKQADTIEELCDEFVAKKDYGKPFVIKRFEIHSNLQFGFTIYGAIWVGADLHSVAKMNNKGEFELL